MSFLKTIDSVLGTNFHGRSQAKNFDKWTNDEQNYNKSINGEAVQEFAMFDFNASSYSSDLKKFSQDYIDKFDADKDGNWNKEEFINMATAGKGISGEYAEQQEAFLTQAFSDLSFDDNAEVINAGEFASYLYLSDMDFEKYAQTGDVASSIDGKVNYDAYQGYSSLDPSSEAHGIAQNEMQSFYDHFYEA